MFRALALAITLFWLVSNVAAACVPPLEDGATRSTGGTRALTESATPTVAATAPAACTVEPRSLPALEQLIDVAGGLDAGSATPAPEPPSMTLAELPAGEPATIETIVAITATTEHLMACLNAGDMLRLLALFSDEFVRTFAAELGFSLAVITEPVTPQPLPEDEWVTLGEVTAARVLPDGRVGAVINADPPDEEPVFFIFVHDRDRDRWLVDEVVEIVDEEEDCCAPPDPSPSPDPSPATTWQPVQGDGYAGVIVPEADAQLVFQSLFGTDQAGYWTPTARDVAELEEAIQTFIIPPPCGESPAPEEIWQNLETYARQYVGFIDDDGRRLILINAFCDDLGIDWQSAPVAVDDGGACFFQLTYDPASGDFFNLAVNGEA